MSILAALPGNAWTILGLGVAAGILSGLLGVGSGILMVPALVIGFSFPQKAAQGTALAVMVPMALAGAIRYWMNPAIEIKPLTVAILATGAVVGAFGGSALAARVPALVLRRIFAVFLVIVAVRMLIGSTGEKRSAAADPAQASLEH